MKTWISLLVLFAIFGGLCGHLTRSSGSAAPTIYRSTLKSIAASTDTRFAKRLNTAKPDQFIALFEEFADLEEPHRGIMISAIISRWASIDPTAAYQYATENELPQRARAIALALLAERDIGRAVTVIEALEVAELALLLRACQENRPDSVTALARSLLEDPRYSMEPAFLASIPQLASELTREQLELLAAPFFSGGDDVDLPVAHHRRLESEFGQIGKNSLFMGSYAKVWAQEDPRGGLEWLANLESRRHWTRVEFMYEWHQYDPAATETYLRQLPASEELYHSVLDSGICYEEGYVDRALDWYDAQPAEVKLDLIDQNPDTVMVHDPGGVLKWAIAKMQEAVVEVESDELFPDEPTPPGVFTRRMIDRLIHGSLDTWLRRDEAAARQWLFDQIDPTLSNQLAAGLGYFHKDYFGPPRAPAVVNERRYSVYEVQNLISDPELRWETLRRTMSFEHSSSAQRHLDASDLPDDVRADLQELIDSGETNDALYAD